MTKGLVASDRANEEQSVETRLWRAVLVSTIQEWMFGPLRRKAEAERYLFGEGTDFASVCEAAGMNAGYLRVRLGKIRRQAALQHAS